MKRTDDMVGLDHYMKRIAGVPVLDREHEQVLARAVRETGCLESEQKLVMANQRFVVKIAMQYRGYNLNILDLVQEGNVGLVVATRKFDPERGLRLVSYAVWWIRAYIQSYIMRSWSLVKVGTTQAQRKLFFKLRSERERAERNGEPGERASIESLAEALNVSPEDVSMMECRLHDKDASLDKKMSDDSTTTPMDLLRSDEVSAEQAYIHGTELKALGNILRDNEANLTQRENDVLSERMLSDNGLTLVELGNRLNISRERVRQIEARAISKVGEVMRRRDVFAAAA